MQPFPNLKGPRGVVPVKASMSVLLAVFRTEAVVTLYLVLAPCYLASLAATQAWRARRRAQVGELLRDAGLCADVARLVQDFEQG